MRKISTQYNISNPMRIIFALCIVITITLSGCVFNPKPITTKNSNLTQGNIQLKIKTGITTKAEILEAFGAPNITTRDGKGNEMWTYQRQAQVNRSYGQSSGWSIILFGQSTNNSGFESSSRMITLIIEFDSNNVVKDFNSRDSNF